ncbi:hypothetical protein ABIA32_002937 [Streptacidiphilus sp. MAP12-20]|uniref:hypothetical protein n=1 Tax=Streptacidiphilus sp. MAP12-20 TaxID=3156299 RepID=UPI003515BDFB
MSDWTERFRALEPLCGRAPSAHNTQPWTLRYESDRVVLGWAAERELPAGDPTRRDLYLSLGAYLETCLIVAAEAGLAVEAEVRVDPEARTFAELRPADAVYPTEIRGRVVARRGCARGPYLPGRLTSEQLALLWGRVIGSGLHELPSGELAALAVRADRWMWRTAPVVAELRQWLRLSPADPRFAQDGLSYEALAMSRAEAIGLRAVLALRAQGPLAGVLAGTQRELFAKQEHSVLILTGQRDTPEGVLATGRDLARLWYTLTELGLRVHPVSQLLDCPATAALLPADALAVFRVGHPLVAPVPSARR